MSVFQNKSGSDGYIKTSLKSRDSGNRPWDKTKLLNGAVSWDDSLIDDEYVSTIQRANTTKIIDVFRYYGIEIDEFNKQIRCPFKFHKDNSPSFTYYSDTNKFHCFGCKNNGYPSDFVALLEDIPKIDAANKLLDNFESDEIDPLIFLKHKEKEELYLKFSLMIRSFIKINHTDHAIKFIDTITSAFDSAAGGRTGYRNVNIDGIKSIVDTLEKRIGTYGCQ